MTERPILFSAPMVRAILDGRKTQTRRVVSHRHVQFIGGRGEENDPSAWGFGDEHGCWHVLDQSARPWFGNGVPNEQYRIACPYGDRGDRLWVRETWCLAHPEYHDENEGRRLGRPVREDGRWCHYRATDGEVESGEREGASPWKPSIHMPRWASRLALEVTGVRVERLQAITEDDARAEGVDPADTAGRWRDYMPEREAPTLSHGSARGSFLSLWEAINGTASLAQNPWVWVVEFRMAQP